MARRFVDLSIAIEVGVPSDPPGMEPKITYTTHAESVPQMAVSFPGLTAADIEAELKRIGHTLQPYDIVVVNTRAGEVFGQPEYIHSGCGMGREATLYLTERGVRVVGTDAWSWDAPFSHTAKRWAETRDPKIIWEGHKAGRHVGYCQIEKLHNLEALPATGFTVACFPVKIERASAGWTRAVAIFES